MLWNILTPSSKSSLCCINLQIEWLTSWIALFLSLNSWCLQVIWHLMAQPAPTASGHCKSFLELLSLAGNPEIWRDVSLETVRSGPVSITFFKEDGNVLKSKILETLMYCLCVWIGYMVIPYMLNVHKFSIKTESYSEFKNRRFRFYTSLIIYLIHTNR